MRFQKQAFTFVELIVVMVIITILATIGFTVYESYISTGRDTKRIVQMKELQTTFQEYALRSELPLPDQALQLRASGSLISYQGNLTDDVVSQTGFKGSSYDDEYESYPVYVLSTNKKDFQFLNYLEDGVNLISSSFTQVLAEPEYGLLFPKIFGKPL